MQPTQWTDQTHFVAINCKRGGKHPLQKKIEKNEKNERRTHPQWKASWVKAFALASINCGLLKCFLIEIFPNFTLGDQVQPASTLRLRKHTDTQGHPSRLPGAGISISDSSTLWRLATPIWNGYLCWWMWAWVWMWVWVGATDSRPEKREVFACLAIATWGTLLRSSKKWKP